MTRATAGSWRYTAGYGWNWRSARAVSHALGSLARPLPPWFRLLVARGALARTALRADARGIQGSAGLRPGGPAGPCPWDDVTNIVVWEFHHLKIVGLARRGDPAAGGSAARALASRPSGQARTVRHRAFRRHPAYPAFIGPDGAPYDAANVLTANGWCVDPARLREVVRHYAPRARFVDLSGVGAELESGVPFGLEVVAGLLELVGWRRLGWLLGVAAAAVVVALAAARLGSSGLDPAALAAGALALIVLAVRAVAVRRRRWRSAHPEAWLGYDRENTGGAPLTRLRRGWLAAWALRVSPLARRRARPGAYGRRPPPALRRGRHGL
jgi:hypothetical protein